MPIKGCCSDVFSLKSLNPPLKRETKFRKEVVMVSDALLDEQLKANIRQMEADIERTKALTGEVDASADLKKAQAEEIRDTIRRRK